ncbi:MAG: NAD-dependent epimerase/dehydratase family protein, partial [Phycisphaerae bacterium]
MTLDQTKDGVAGKAFVTGAAGCVGRELVRQLLKQGAEIWCLLLPGEEERFPFAEDCRISVVTGDINNLSPRSVPTGSTIYHLAAKVHVVPQNEQERQSFFEVNRDGTRHLAEIAVDRQAVGFVFISTIAVYGDALRFSIPNEAAPTNPTSA